jgi:hypothetical protein
MSEQDIAARLRMLQREARKLNGTLIHDLEPFRNQKETDLFRRLPNSESKKGDVNVTTSCTALMALCANGEFDSFFDLKAKPKEINVRRREGAKTTLAKIVGAKWESSGLDENNAFTTAMVIRTAGFVVFDFMPAEIRDIRKTWRKKSHSLGEIAVELAKQAPDVFRLDDSLRANPALGYWLVDGADRLKVDLGEEWVKLARWATTEFAHQFSLVSAHDDAIMDPVAMAMAACLAERLRSIASRPSFSKCIDVKRVLPTRLELESGIDLLFEHQEPSGIWDKFFPMFYYKDPAKPAGANFCFAFEFLEAILNEFGSAVLRNEKIVTGLEKACGWCRNKRLQYSYRKEEYRGWNSAQQLDTVQVGKPESWATGVVHMYLHRLHEVLADEIQRHILEKYNAKYIEARPRKKSLWQKFMSPLVEFRDGDREKLTDVMEREIVAPCIRDTNVDANAVRHLLVQDRHRRSIKLSNRRSALLFGPPGTSKTTLVEAIAEKLGWPYVEITPSHFLREGLGQIYEEANKIFEDLMDLSGVVILFDEMDALVQRRGAGDGRAQLDVTRQFLTTSMLPKLAKMHANAQAVFFMATNHRREFDEAIVRPGRFDLLLCMGPPPWTEKKERLEIWMSESEENRDKCKGIIVEWVNKNPTLEQMLDFFTYGEMKELFDSFRRSRGSLEKWLKGEKERGFERTIRDWYEKMITLREGSENRTEYDQFDKHASRIQ